MPRVFSYGSLQRSEVQLATFGVQLPGVADTLSGFELENIHRDGKQLANVVRGARASRVAGMVLEFTDAQLVIADEYERADNYRRSRVTLESGLEAWVYADASGKKRSAKPSG
jgi:gamma-glutamylcyclotransferase (GGCT)/AIG2-like uncharacterized protein YtfP